MSLKSILLSAVVTLTIIGATSCTSSKSSLTYFKDLSNVTEKTFEQGEYGIRIQPDDELFISVTSLVPEATAQYNLPLMNPGLRGNMGITTTTPQSQTYVVDPKGDIIFPVFGVIHVEGMTVEALSEKISKLVSKDVADPIVKVELMNFKFNVLGEVNSPGVKRVDAHKVSIFDALAMAGDLTSYGKRENVALIREENGKRVLHRINLNSSEVFESPYYYLQQNDVIYVEPNKILEDNSKYNQNNAYKLSLTSTIVSAASVIASLVIALTVK